MLLVLLSFYFHQFINEISLELLFHANFNDARKDSPLINHSHYTRAEYEFIVLLVAKKFISFYFLLRMINEYWQDTYIYVYIYEFMEEFPLCQEKKKIKNVTTKFILAIINTCIPLNTVQYHFNIYSYTRRTINSRSIQRHTRNLKLVTFVALVCLKRSARVLISSVKKYYCRCNSFLYRM